MSTVICRVVELSSGWCVYTFDLPFSESSILVLFRRFASLCRRVESSDTSCRDRMDSRLPPSRRSEKRFRRRTSSSSGSSYSSARAGGSSRSRLTEVRLAEDSCPYSVRASEFHSGASWRGRTVEALDGRRLGRMMPAFAGVLCAECVPSPAPGAPICAILGREDVMPAPPYALCCDP